MSTIDFTELFLRIFSKNIHSDISLLSQTQKCGCGNSANELDVTKVRLKFCKLETTLQGIQEEAGFG